MINRLGVPINYNETRALIASSNKRETETLNLEEFMHLIFSDNPALNIDLKNIKYKDEKLFSEGEQTENLKRSMMHNIIEMSKTEDLGFLKEYLRVRIPVLVRHFNEETNNEGVCDFEQLRKVVGRFGIPEKFTKEPVLQAIYNQFEKGDKMDYKKLVDHLLDNKDLNDFFDFKEKYINRLKEKIEQNQNTMQESVKALREEQDAKLKLAEEIAKDIEIHKKKSESRDKWTQGINISQPSTEFINKVFANKSEHFNKHLEIEKEFSAHPSLITGNCY